MKEKPYILVVDDDPNISRLVTLYLEREGYEVKTAARGDDAVNEFTRLPPDMMLLDVMLPGMDGYQVLKSVRKSSAIPVIMLTARDETFDKVLGLELGADDYITKPFDAKELVARVKAVLRRTQGGEEEKKNDLSFPGLTVSLLLSSYHMKPLTLLLTTFPPRKRLHGLLITGIRTGRQIERCRLRGIDPGKRRACVFEQLRDPAQPLIAAGL